MRRRIIHSLSLPAVAVVLAMLIALAAASGQAAPPNYYQIAVSEDNPIVYYDFNEAVGEQYAYNYGSAGEEGMGMYHGVQLGQPTLYPDHKMLTCGWYEGKAQTTVPGLAALNVGLGDFSIEFWFRAETAERLPLFSNRSSDMFDFSISVEGGLDNMYGGMLWVRDHTPDSELLARTSVWEGEWHHLVLSRMDGNYDLFIDAAKFSLGAKQSLTMPPGPGEVPTTDFNADMYGFEKMIGGSADDAGNMFGFVGLIDEFAFYGAALGQERVNAHYSAAGGTPPVPEPSTLTLLAAVLAAFIAYGWGKRNIFKIYNL